jgi:O-antigen/teichoic acid export membrane protein
MLISLLVYIKMLGKLYINFKFIQISKKLFKEMLLYGLILILGGIGVNLILFLDRNIIANQIGTIAVAIFVVSSYISSIIEIPAKAIRQISAPIMSEAIFKNNNDKVEELYNKSALNLMLIGGLMFLLVSLNVDQILSLLPKSNIYMKGKWIVIILGFCKWIDMSLGLNSEMIAFSKYFKINTYLVISLAILAVFLNYLLIPIFGVEGSAFATGLVTITSSVFRMWYVNLKFKISPYSDKTLTVILILLFCGLVGYVTPIFGNSFFSISSSILFKSSLVIFVFVFLCLKFAISSDFSNLFSSIMLKFRKLN